MSVALNPNNPAVAALLESEEVQNWEEDPDGAIEYLEGVKENALEVIDDQLEEMKAHAEEEIQAAIDEKVAAMEADKEHHFEMLDMQSEDAKTAMSAMYDALIDAIQEGKDPATVMSKPPAAKTKTPAKTPSGKTRSVALKKKKSSGCC